MLLKVINDILFESDTSFITANFQSEKEIIDPIIGFIRDNNAPALRLYAVELIKILGFKSPHWLHELISIFLSFTAITNADIATMK